MSDRIDLYSLALIKIAADAIEKELHSAAVEALNNGASYRGLAKVLGISFQAAHTRYSGEVDPARRAAARPDLAR